MNDDGEHTVYCTPQLGFFDPNMSKFNELAIHSVACPAKVPQHLANYVRLPSGPIDHDDLDVQWIWSMEKIRTLDHITTEMYKLNVADLMNYIVDTEGLAFNKPDLDWLEELTDHQMALRILAQIRPVILNHHFNQNGDVFIRQALNAYTNAKLCDVGTLLELEDIRKAARKHQHRGPRHFRGFRRNGPHYRGPNIQAWPMPNLARRRYGGFINGRPISVHEPELGAVDPHKTLNKAKEPATTINPVKCEQPETGSPIELEQGNFQS